MNDHLRSDIILSVNRALIGEVFSQLIAVSCSIAIGKRIELTFFVDSVLPDPIIEDISCIETEVIADFSDDFNISHRIVVVDRADLSPGGFWIFLRKLA
jgi:hypothetical protein